MLSSTNNQSKKGSNPLLAGSSSFSLAESFGAAAILAPTPQVAPAPAQNADACGGKKGGGETRYLYQQRYMI